MHNPGHRKGFIVLRFVAVCLVAIVFGACSSPPPAPQNSVTITSKPEGAFLMIDGTVYGQTPVTIDDIAPGEHYAILEMENHKRLNHRFVLVPDTPLELELALIHHFGNITFNTQPDGARVYLITSETSELGVLFGETPLDNASLNTGSYSFQIQRENFHPIQGELRIESGQYYTEAHTLAPIIAKIQILSRPTGAGIWINDEKRPEVTPANINLPPGEYSIGVYKSGYVMDEQTVDLKPNDNISVNATLKEGDMPLEMVLIPAGEFTFGDANKSPDEKPLKKIHLDAFYMDKNEVTNADFKNVFPGHEFEERREKYPVRGITWKQASDYARAVGKRLPTEMEWEKAARGAQGKEYPWGVLFKEGLANTATNLSSDIRPIGSFKKGVSQYGCYDMAGNVYEWVNDWYNPYPGNPEVQTDYGTVYKVLRGGSFKSDAFEVRSAKRHYDKPDAQREDYGFRCAKDITR